MEGLGFLVLMAFLLCLYFLPALVAGARHHHNVQAILALNLLLGWTLLGWAGALIWALTTPSGPRPPSPCP